MICTLIEAAEVNDLFARSIEKYLIKTGISDVDRSRQGIMLGRIARASYRLGAITGTDLDNYEIFGGMVEVMSKVRDMIYEGRI